MSECQESVGTVPLDYADVVRKSQLVTTTKWWVEMTQTLWAYMSQQSTAAIQSGRTETSTL